MIQFLISLLILRGLSGGYQVIEADLAELASHIDEALHLYSCLNTRKMLLSCLIPAMCFQELRDKRRVCVLLFYA